MTLRQFDLNTMNLRHHYVGERGQIGKIRSQLLALEHPSLAVSSSFSKQQKKDQHVLTPWDTLGLLIIGFVMVSFVGVGIVALQNQQSLGEQLFLGYQKLLSQLPVVSLPTDTTEEPAPTPTQVQSPTLEQKQTVSISSIVNKDDAWGAMAINPKQSSYQPGEMMSFSFGIVDPKGTTICDAALTFLITVRSEHKTYTLSTQDGTILRSRSCSPTNVTHKADYTAQFPAKLASEVYQLELKAQTKLGTNVMQDQVKVGSEQFTVVRTDFPTRIYPGSPYWLGFTVTAQEDFVGEIRESVPAKDFSIRQVSSGGEFKLSKSASGDKRFEIVWPVTLRRGQQYSFSYTMQFPPLSPDVYNLGPLKILDQQGREAFTESRAWQVVADEYNLQYINL